MPRGVFVRKDITKKRISRSLRKSWKKRKQMLEEELEEKRKKDSKADEGRNKCDFVKNRINCLGKDELSDELAKIRYEILDSVKRLGREFKKLTGLQEKRDKIEIRLDEMGGHIGSVKSKAGNWREGEG